MRYNYIPGPISSSIYAKTYICNHPVYDRCTLYRNGKRGLAVIQQRYIAKTKAEAYEYFGDPDDEDWME